MYWELICLIRSPFKTDPTLGRPIIGGALFTSKEINSIDINI